jgi:hypothetical protein
MECDITIHFYNSFLYEYLFGSKMQVNAHIYLTNAQVVFLRCPCNVKDSSTMLEEW